LADTLVRPAGVEIGYVLRQHAPEVPLAEDEQVIDALASDAAEEALADGVCPRRADGRADHLEAACGRDPSERRPVVGVVVVDQEPGSGALRRRLAQLLGDSRVGGGAGDADVDDPPRPQLDDDLREQGPEDEVGQPQDVARPDIPAVGPQERGPSLAGGARRAGAAHVPLDCALADDDPQLE
jgi:hypothetical protein